jgi:DNA-binding MarR family transcriptional regulator
MPLVRKGLNGLRGHTTSAESLGKGTASMRPDSVATVLQQWRRQMPGLDLGPLGLFVALAHAYWLTAPKIERLMADHGLTRGMFDVLTTLRRPGPPYTLSPKRLTQSLLLSGAGLTSRLDRLESKKLISRKPDLRDRRGLQIQLTAKGMRLVDRILPKLIRLEARLVAGLTVTQTEALMRLLDIFVVNVRAVGDKGNKKIVVFRQTLKSAASVDASEKRKWSMRTPI